MKNRGVGFLLLAVLHAAQPLQGEPAPPLSWKVESPYCLMSDPALGYDGRLYAAAAPECTDENLGVSAFDPVDGSLVWGPVIPPGCTGKFGEQGVSVGANGLVYATGDWNECSVGRLTAFQGTNGSVAWDHSNCSQGIDESPHPRQTPAIDDELGKVYFGSSYLCSVDMATGSRSWAGHGGHYIGDRGMAIDSLHNVFYGTVGGAYGGRIRSYSGTGTFRWQNEVSHNELRVLAVLADDTLLSYDGGSNRLVASGSDGTELWHVDDLTNPVSDSTGNLYANSVNTASVVSLDAGGDERWRRSLPSAPWAKVDFVDRSGRVYARGGSTLYALNTSDGQIAWSFEADAEIHTAAVLTSEGDLFLADLDSNFYRLDTALAYAISSWPVARYGDSRHTQKMGEPEQGLSFFTLSPCRVFDTRSTSPLQSGVDRVFQMAGICGIPTSARSVTVNVTVASPTGLGNVTIFPADLPVPLASTINFALGRTRANNAIVNLSTTGVGSIGARAFVAGGGQVHLIVDVTGYFE